MDDLSGKISELLRDPAAMAQIQSLAASLGLGGSGEAGGTGGSGEQGADRGAPAGQGERSPSGDGLLSALSGLLGQQREQPAAGGELAQSLLRMAPLLGSLRQETPGTQLLHALRPLLSPARQERLDQAIRLLQLTRVLPLLKSSGLF